MTNFGGKLSRARLSVPDKRTLPLLIAAISVGCVMGCSGEESQSSPIVAGGTVANGGADKIGGATGSGGTSTSIQSAGTVMAIGGATKGTLVSQGGTATSSSGGATGGITSAAAGGAALGGSSKGGTKATGVSSTGGAYVGGVKGTGGATAFGGSATGGGSTSNAVKSAGCGKAPTLTSGSHTIQSGGQSRSYMLRTPANYDNTRPYRLIFAFHWNGGTMGDVDGGGTSGYTWSYYGLREQADARSEVNTIFVAPQGNGNGWANPGGADLTFVDDLLKLFEGDLCIDTTRIFSMGFSYGGGMTFSIACARATVFRAAAVYAGAQLSGCSDGTKPIAYIGVHGLRDPTCRIAGGRTLRDKFVENNGCTAQTPPEPAANSLTHVCTTYSGCTSGYPVRWCAFDGAGHSPAPVDGTTSDYGGGDKTWTKAEVWKFFTQF